MIYILQRNEREKKTEFLSLINKLQWQSRYNKIEI